MPEDFELQNEQMETIRQERELLLRQITESQQVIRQSQELLGRLDELLANASVKL